MGNPRLDAGMIAILMGCFAVAVRHDGWEVLFGLFYICLGGYLMITDSSRHDG